MTAIAIAIAITDDITDTPPEFKAASAARPFDLRDGVALAFGALLAPAIDAWTDAVLPVFDGRLPDWLDLPAVTQAHADALARRWATMAARTLVLELNVARLSHRLAGADPASRFRDFFMQLSQPIRLSAFLAEYSVLGRKLQDEAEAWRRANIEALTALRDDARAIAGHIGIDLEIEQLQALKPHADGDHHDEGRCVLVAAFASGRRLLFKPRPSQLDVHFHALVDWIGARDPSLRFRVPATITGARHGWCEHVRHRRCSTASEAGDFYRRHGEYLALLYALDACDMHVENVIADGAWPVLVDLEALFHPALAEPRADIGPETCGIEDALSRTVLKVGLLPCRLHHGDGQPGSDVGGMTAPVRQHTTNPVLVAEAEGTDTMRFVRKQGTFDAPRHRVTLSDGSTPTAIDHVDAVVEGFEHMYRFLVDWRGPLQAPDGPLACFTGDRVRVLLRATRVYARLLQEATHPDLMRDEQAHRTFLQRLAVVAPKSDSHHRPGWSSVRDAEVDDLAAGDVPLFWTQVDSTRLHATRGRTIDGVISGSARDALDARLRAMGPRDEQRQVWIIRASLAAVAPEASATAIATSSASATATAAIRQASTRARSDFPAAPATALHIARQIGDRLDTLAFEAGDQATWLGLQACGASGWTVAPLRDDLYGGRPGIALFLAYLGHATGENKPRALAWRAVRAWLAATPPSLDRKIGAFNGLGGGIFVLTHLGVLWRDDSLLQRAESWAVELGKCIALDRHFDVVSGAAGAIAALLALHAVTGSPSALQSARVCGAHLVACAERQQVGWGWRGIDGSVPLGGFSHGAAGIAWALSRLAVASGETHFADAARHAFAYDASLHCPITGRWRDLRPGASAGESTPGRWCHGGPGIALARLDAPSQMQGSSARNDLAVALRSTLRHRLGSDRCLCHGDLGVFETLLRASRRLERKARWARRTQRALHRVVDNLMDRGWRCGIPLAAESPGLMTGLAGIGYGLLRAAMPDRVPSLLLLEPPRHDEARP